MNPMWITLVPQDQHHNTLPSMMHHPWNTTPFSPYDYFLGPSMTSPFWTSPTLVNPFNLLKSLLPPFTLHHRRSLPLKTYKRPLFLSICGIIYLLSPWIWKKATPPEQKHMISFHQQLDEVASMTYQAYQTCALSSSFILRTLNIELLTCLPDTSWLSNKVQVLQTLLFNRKNPLFCLMVLSASWHMIEDDWRLTIHHFKMRINLWLQIYLLTTLYLQWKCGPLPMTML